MDTLLEMRTAVRSDLNVSANSSLFPAATIDLAINRAYVKSYRMFRWPRTEGAVATTTQANQFYYDNPSIFVPDSIWRLQVDGVQYGEDPDGSAINFRDFLTWKENNPNDDTKRWARQWTRYFFSPTPVAAGLQIVVWGQKNVDKLTVDASETMFSYNLPECNEAIVMEAEAILKHKGATPQDGAFYSAEAKLLLGMAHKRIKQDSTLEKKIMPMLNVPDFFPGNVNRTQITSNFSTQL